MHRLHEAMEVHAQLSVDTQLIIESIHNEGLTAPYAAPKVQAAWRLRSSPQRFTEAATYRRQRSVIGEQLIIKFVKTLDCHLLYRIILNQALLNICLVAC